MVTNEEKLSFGGGYQFLMEEGNYFPPQSTISAPLLVIVCSYCKKEIIRVRGWDVNRIVRKIVREELGGKCPFCKRELRGEIDWEEVEYFILHHR